MRALLLAAGFGSRLRPITETIPKCLVPINGQPLLDIWLKMLQNSGVSSVLINTHYLAEKVENFISEMHYDKFVSISYEKELLGTAGTIKKNRLFFCEEAFMLIHADNLSRFDVNEFIKRHRDRPACCEITMMTFVTPTPSSCGIVTVDANGIVQEFYEKVPNPPGSLANGAVYIVEPSVLHFINSLESENADFSTDVLPYFLGKIYTYHNCKYHRDIGTVESYCLANVEYN